MTDLEDKIELRHFAPAEFACSCGAGCNKGFADMNARFLRRLDAARELAGTPFVITSAMRCPEHNERVGGVPDSEHLHGQAVDIAAAGSRQRYHTVRGAVESGFSRIGVGRTFIHLGGSPDKPAEVMWLYD